MIDRKRGWDVQRGHLGWSQTDGRGGHGEEREETMVQQREKRATADRHSGKTQLEEWPVSK